MSHVYNINPPSDERREQVGLLLRALLALNGINPAAVPADAPIYVDTEHGLISAVTTYVIDGRQLGLANPEDGPHVMSRQTIQMQLPVVPDALLDGLTPQTGPPEQDSPAQPTPDPDATVADIDAVLSGQCVNVYSRKPHQLSADAVSGWWCDDRCMAAFQAAHADVGDVALRAEAADYDRADQRTGRIPLTKTPTYDAAALGLRVRCVSCDAFQDPGEPGRTRCCQCRKPLPHLPLAYQVTPITTNSGPGHRLRLVDLSNDRFVDRVLSDRELRDCAASGDDVRGYVDAIWTRAMTEIDRDWPDVVPPEPVIAAPEEHQTVLVDPTATIDVVDDLNSQGLWVLAHHDIPHGSQLVVRASPQELAGVPSMLDAVVAAGLNDLEDLTS